MRGQEAFAGHPDLVGFGGLEVGDQVMSGLVLVGDGPNGASTQNRRAQILAGIGREVEEVCIFTHRGAFGEEGRDERRLAVHVALRRRREETLRAVAEIGGRYRAGAARHIGVVAGKGAELVDRGDHFGAVERQLVGHPPVIDGR